MNLPKFRRFYFPGLISLIFLPVMYLSYLVETNVFYKPGGLPLTVCDTKYFPESKFLKLRKYQKLIITGTSPHDSIQLTLFSERLKLLIAKNDTKNGILVLFGDKSDYSEFVNVLDICYLNYNKGLFFAPSHNKLFVGHVVVQPGPAASIGDLGNDVIHHNTVGLADSLFDESMDMVSSKIYYFTIKYWAPILVFMLMILFTFSNKRRFFDLKHFRFVGH